MQCDCMRKLIVAEVSMFKNIEYDLLNISKQMEYLDTQKEIEIFVEEGKNSNSNRIVSEDKPEEDIKRSSQSESPNEYQIQLKKMLGKSMLSNSLLHVDEEYFSWMLFNKVVLSLWRKTNNSETSSRASGKCTEKQGNPSIQKMKISQFKSQNNSCRKGKKSFTGQKKNKK